MKTPEEVMKDAPSLDDVKKMHKEIGKKPKKQYQGVTIGMCMNNATQLIKSTQIDSDYGTVAKKVLDMTELLLEEMDKRGL